MDNLHPPQSAETKKYLEEECGLVPYQPHGYPNWADPDSWSYHMYSAAIFGLAAYGRWYAPKIGVTRFPFTVNMLAVPAFYFLSIHQKEKRFTYDSGPRRTFEQNLEFFPVTRRAWNRAMAIYDEEKAANQK